MAEKHWLTVMTESFSNEELTELIQEVLKSREEGVWTGTKLKEFANQCAVKVGTTRNEMMHIAEDAVLVEGAKRFLTF